MNCTGFALVNYRAGTYNYVSDANFPIHASCTLRLSSALTFAEFSILEIRHLSKTLVNYVGERKYIHSENLLK